MPHNQPKDPCHNNHPSAASPPKSTLPPTSPTISNTPAPNLPCRHQGSVPTSAEFLQCLYAANSAPSSSNSSRRKRRGSKRGCRDYGHLVTQIPAPPYRAHRYPRTIDCINLISSDDEESRARKRQRKQSTATRQPSIDAKDTDASDDIVIVSHVVRAPKRKGGSRAETGDGREEGGGGQVQKGSGVKVQEGGGLQVQEGGAQVQERRGVQKQEGVKVVGMRRGVRVLEDYPHFRFHCGVERFDTKNIEGVRRFCNRCFCYVCDVPARMCKSWEVHKWAVDSKAVWKDMRKRVRESVKKNDK